MVSFSNQRIMYQGPPLRHFDHSSNKTTYAIQVNNQIYDKSIKRHFIPNISLNFMDLSRVISFNCIETHKIMHLSIYGLIQVKISQISYNCMVLSKLFFSVILLLHCITLYSHINMHDFFTSLSSQNFVQGNIFIHMHML